MNRELESINQRDFLISALKENIRCDGRKVSEYRGISISLDPLENRSRIELSLGKTKVAVYIDARIARPHLDRSVEGSIQFKVSFLPHFFEKGQKDKDEEETHISRYIEAIFRDSRIVDTESLCIVAGEKVWSLTVYLHILNSDGNILDCSSHAVITALLHFRRPEVTVLDDGSIIVHSFQDKNPLPLIIHYLPITLSFVFFEEGSWSVIDPTLAEELYSAGLLTLTIDCNSKSVCGMHKKGISLKLDYISSCIEFAYTKAIELSNHIRVSIKK